MKENKNEVQKIHIKQKIKKFGKDIFAKFFGFEQGIDITDDVAVLHRRNIVIKNIIFVSNVVYSILLFINSLTTNASNTDWAITIVAFPVTFVVNTWLTRLIKVDTKDKSKQMIATYVASFYIFLSSVLIYARLYNQGNLETVSYVLLYYALVVISLYQDKKILATSFFYMFVLMTSIHLVFTYNFLSDSEGQDMFAFLSDFVSSPQFGDLILRTIVFSLFFLVVYVIVSIGQYMQDERKSELLKRRQVQNDFSLIVGNLFQAVFINSYIFVNKEHAYQVQRVSEQIATFVGMNSAEIKNLSEYAIIHLRYEEVKDLNISESIYDDKAYEALKVKTNLGSNIVKRTEISQNCESIVRSQIESTATDEKMQAILETQRDQTSQIILLAEIYLTLRSANSYKRPFTHRRSISLIIDQIGPFFPIDLMERFEKFSDELEEIYNDF
ncbi:MAG TPA: hypothetical protein GX742_03995 [Acholeplasmataceae bacterium]|nr:hypothetical protein [Acholeplasmataceae bacterium]